jgi:hypothetical protein
MAYRYSKTDNDNIAWFKNDMTKATLLGIELSVGKLRGLSHFSIDIQYPITRTRWKKLFRQINFTSYGLLCLSQFTKWI